MSAPILLLAPGPDIDFGAAPSGAAYRSNQYGLVAILNGSIADEAALIAAGCAVLQPATQTPFPVSALPPAALGCQRYFVSDSSATALGNFGAAVTGGGANTVPVYSDGAVWRIG
jgi:hypothetical protein